MEDELGQWATSSPSHSAPGLLPCKPAVPMATPLTQSLLPTQLWAAWGTHLNQYSTTHCSKMEKGGGEESEQK